MKQFILIVSLIFICACAPTNDTHFSAAHNVKQPNVVFILVDDMGFGDVGYNGSEIATPNLDQLANDGVRLDRNYVYPICSPTRAALLTGQSPLSFGIDGPMSDEHSLPVDVRIMPEYFKDLGYQTFMVGKWHLGIGEKAFWPNARGFDYHYGFLGGWVDFYTHVYADGLDWIRNGVVVEEEGHATDLFTADAQRVIQSRDKDEPFLLYLAYNAPHTPLQNVPNNSGLNDGVEQGNRGVYAEMATHADAGIGQVIETLKAEGILENTIIVFSSDNGGQLNAGSNNGDLRGAKGSAFEGGMRVPGVVWWVGHVDGGKVLEQPIAVHDWLPTLIDAVGGDAASVENAYGQSMWAALADNKTLKRKPIVIGVRNTYAAIDWPWKYVQFVEGRGANEKQAYGLFNVLEDPEEKKDLSAQYPEKVATLKAMLDARPIAESISEKTRDHAAASFYVNDPETGFNFDERLQPTSIPWVERVKK